MKYFFFLYRVIPNNMQNVHLDNFFKFAVSKS